MSIRTAIGQIIFWGLQAFVICLCFYDPEDEVIITYVVPGVSGDSQLNTKKMFINIIIKKMQFTYYIILNFENNEYLP